MMRSLADLKDYVLKERRQIKRRQEILMDDLKNDHQRQWDYLEGIDSGLALVEAWILNYEGT